MRILNYEIRKIPDLKNDILEQAELNARRGLIAAKLELRHHTLLHESAIEANRTVSEVTGYIEAIERDNKSINNWENQLIAIQYERENN